MLLDQLDLHGAGLCDGDLDLDRAHLAAVVGPLLHDGQDVEGTDAEGPHPRSGGGEDIVDDVTELEEPELAFGPWLFEQRMSRWRHCVGIHADDHVTSAEGPGAHSDVDGGVAHVER